MKSTYDHTLNELKTRCIFTKDQKELEDKKGHLVFVWDNMKVGYPWDKYFFCEKYLGSAFTVESNFIMYNPSSGPPVLIHDSTRKAENQPYLCRVAGDVYYTDWRKIAQLDAIMANGFDFKRVERYIALKDQSSPYKEPNRKITAKAWVYIATSKFFSSFPQLTPSVRYCRDEGFVYDWMKYEAHGLSH